MLNKWYTIHKPKLAVTTASLYKMYLDKHIIPVIGAVKLKDLKPMVLDEFYNKKLEEVYDVKNNKKLSPNTVIKLHKLILTALNYAVTNDIIESNPASKVTPIKKVVYKPKIYNEEKFNNLLDAVAGTFDEIPILLAGAVGLRRGEVFGIRSVDLDFKENTITVEETKVKWDKYIIKDPKSESSKRTIITYPFVMQVIKNYLGSLDVVPERVCDKFKPAAYSEHFKKLLIKYDLPVIRFHDLRHYNAIIMLKYGISDKVASERLGHASTAMLKNIYQHTTDDMHEDAAKKIENALSKKPVSQIDSQGIN